MASQKDAQLRFLESGFLKTLGRQKTDEKLSVSAEILKETGEYIVTALKKNLVENDIQETSSLYQSIDYDVSTSGSFVILTVSLNKYYIFVDQGVKGKKSGYSRMGFAYKDKMPPLKAFIGTKGWIARKPLKEIAGIPMNSPKNNKLGGYIVQRSVFNHGIKATGFHASVVTDNLFKSIQEALAEQTINAFYITIDGINKDK